MGDSKQGVRKRDAHALALPVERAHRACLRLDSRKVPGDGRVIVFCDTKRDCGELQEALQRSLTRARRPSTATEQSQRELSLLVSGRQFQTLVATDAGAWMDISGVELVVQCEPPKEQRRTSIAWAHRPRQGHWHLRHPLHAA